MASAIGAGAENLLPCWLLYPYGTSVFWLFPGWWAEHGKLLRWLLCPRGRKKLPGILRVFAGTGIDNVNSAIFYWPKQS